MPPIAFPIALSPLLWLMLLSSHAPATQASVPTTQPAFPASWIGRWTGPATVINPGGKQQDFEMELAVAPTDDPNRFTWEIVYIFNGKRQVRPYEIVTIDPAKGRYLIDEKNSIRIDAFLIGDVLASQFKVMSSNITASYRVDGEKLIVELITTDTDRPAVSGGEGNVPNVQSYPATAIQRAVLTKSR